MTCKNCGSSLQGKFCNDCGQSASVGKINLSNFISELSESVFQLNRGLLFTIQQLFLRPGKSINDFLDGKRKHYFKPIAFVLVLSTVYFFVSQLSDSNTLLDNFFSGFNNMDSNNGRARSKVSSSVVVNWLSDNYAYATLILLPVYSLSTFISFLGYGRNYLENIVINSYITGQQAIIYIFFLIFGVIFDKLEGMASLSILVAMLYNFWVFTSVFSKKNVFIVILRLLLTYILYYIFLTILLAVIALEIILSG